MVHGNSKEAGSSDKNEPNLSMVIPPSPFSACVPLQRRDMSPLWLNQEDVLNNDGIPLLITDDDHFVISSNENAPSLLSYNGDAGSSSGTFEDKLKTLPSLEDIFPGMEVVPILLPDDDLSVLTTPDEEETIHVEPEDVLCGRGGVVNKHWGNQTFHLEKAAVQPSYLQTAKRQEKQEIAQDLFDRMKHVHGSRFLYCDKKKKWRVKSDDLALLKVKQALRETLDSEQRKEKRDKHKRKKLLAQKQHSDCSDS